MASKKPKPKVSQPKPKPKPKTSQPFIVKVGPHRYEVITDRAAIDRNSVVEKAELNGITDHSTLQIVLAPDLAVGVRNEILVHEILHTLVSLSGLGSNNGTWSDTEEEDVVTRLAPLVLMFIQDNPDVIEQLSG